jgi:hypothetical protein
MPFVIRDHSGSIQALQDSGALGGEWLEVSHPDVEAFLKQLSGRHAMQALSDSDSDMVRVIDDLVDLLVARQVLIFTELPERVQSKLLDRKQLRKDAGTLQNLMVDDERLF